jgi:hypothetical protein
MKFKKGKPLPFEIDIKGKPKFSDNFGFIREAGKNILAVEIDLESKYCDIIGFGSSDDVPTIYITTTDRSLHLNEKEENDTTNISFKVLNGWSIFSSELLKYTLSICFIKK